MNNQDIQTKIDNYLLVRMTEAERQDFETEMAADNKLKESVELQRLLVTEIQQRAFITEIIVETKKCMEKEETEKSSIPFPHPIPDVDAFMPPAASLAPPAASTTFSFRKIMLITWSAAAIFIGVFFVNSAVQNSKMDSIYTANYSAPETAVMRGDDLRGGDSTETDFLQAIKFLNTNQPKQAQEILLKLYQITDTFTYYEDVRWYLALTELKLHNKSEAKKYLNELIDSEFYGEKVKKLLEEL